MKKEKELLTDLEVCREKIIALLKEYNCVIETDDYHFCWLRDKDTNETVGGISR